jgi:hypothetical protein
MLINFVRDSIIAGAAIFSNLILRPSVPVALPVGMACIISCTSWVDISEKSNLASESLNFWTKSETVVGSNSVLTSEVRLFARLEK